MLSTGATVATVDRRFLRPGWLFGHVLVLVSFVVCCRLGVWQWDRTHDADGTLQNLSYAILWPVFGIAFIYMWIKFLLLERAKDAVDDQDMDDGIAAILQEAVPGGDAAGLNGVVTDRAAPDNDLSDNDVLDKGVGDGAGTGVDDVGSQDSVDEWDDCDDGQTFIGTVADVDDDEDPEMAAYNRALAALAERDEHRGS